MMVPYGTTCKVRFHYVKERFSLDVGESHIGLMRVSLCRSDILDLLGCEIHVSTVKEMVTVARLCLSARWY